MARFSSDGGLVSSYTRLYEDLQRVAAECVWAEQKLEDIEAVLERGQQWSGVKVYDMLSEIEAIVKRKEVE